MLETHRRHRRIGEARSEHGEIDGEERLITAYAVRFGNIGINSITN